MVVTECVSVTSQCFQEVKTSTLYAYFYQILMFEQENKSHTQRIKLPPLRNLKKMVNGDW